MYLPTITHHKKSLMCTKLKHIQLFLRYDIQTYNQY